MKPHLKLLTTALAAALACSGAAQAETASEQANAHADARAEARADGDGQTKMHKQSVTVTSDGKRTIKKTVTVRDGKEEVLIETTDEDGKTTTSREGDQDPAKQKQGDQADDKSPWLGVQVQEAPQVLRDQLGLGENGVVVGLVAPDSPAAKAGIQRNDILLQFAGKKLSTADDLRAELRNHQAGESVKVEVLSKGERKEVEVTLAERPEQQENENQDHPDLVDRVRKQQGQDGDSKVEIEISGDGGRGGAGGSAGGSAGLDAVLNDPNLPEDFKKTVREMQEKMKEFEKKHAPR